MKISSAYSTNISPDTKPLSAPTRTDTTTAAIFMFTSLSIPCGLKKYPYCPTWTDRQTPVPGANTDVRTPLWNTSKPKSWRCATGKISIRLTCSTAVKTALPSVSIGHRRKGSLPLIKKMPLLLPPDSL